MKRLLFIVVLFCFASKAECRVTRKDVQAAYCDWQYRQAQWVDFCDEIRDQVCTASDSVVINADVIYSYKEAIIHADMLRDLADCARLAYEGYKDIRHDQRFWVRKE